MKCPIETQETLELLLAYCARKLDGDTAVWLERHIASCPACRSTYEAQRVVWEALDEWEAAPVAPDFDRRLYRRIDEETRAPWWERLSRGARPMLIGRGLPLAAAAGLLVVAGVIMERPGRIEPQPATQVEAVQADEVEKTLEDMELLHNLAVESRGAAQQPNSM